MPVHLSNLRGGSLSQTQNMLQSRKNLKYFYILPQTPLVQ